MMTQGSIDWCLKCGEYDQGDMCLVSYDELYDLVEQAKLLNTMLVGHSFGFPAARKEVERRTNRDLHPCLDPLKEKASPTQ